MTVIIRRATREDYASLAPIDVESQEKHADALPHIFQHGAISLSQEHFLEYIESDTKAIYVAESAGSIVGYVLLAVEKSNLELFVPRSLVYITDIAVLKAHQKQGIGHLLFQQGVEWAKEQGAASLDLTVWEFNESARTFYERHGMRTLTRQMTLAIE